MSDVASGRKFHVSLNVADLTRSVDFYRVLFSMEPAKCRSDYAKFELTDPPVVLSLEPLRHAPGGALNHLGLRVSQTSELVEIQRRLETAGLNTQREEGVECCYARQTKFWIADPDRNSWEVYVVEEDLEHKGMSPRGGSNPAAADPSSQEASPTVASVPTPRMWEHQLGAGIPASIPHADRSLDEVMLRGTFNETLPGSEIDRLLAEVRRALIPGGRVTVHGLIADRPLKTPPTLPGPAAAVQRVPLLGEPLGALQRAGFIDLTLEKLGGACCFRHDDIGLRELLLSGLNPANTRFDVPQTVVYLGPMLEVRDDAGNLFRRGQPAEVHSSVASKLLQSAPASFVILVPGDVPHSISA